MTYTISPLDLARRLDDADSAPFVLDVRAPDQFERWRVEGAFKPETRNVPYWTALEDVDTTVSTLPTDQDVVVICAHGGSSGMLVDMIGLPQVVNLDGGMRAWAQTLVPHPLLDDGRRFVVQYDRIAKACLSYAVGTRDATMCVVDPAVDPEIYLRHAAEYDAEITDVFDTHLHADHVSVARRLADVAGATYHISEGDAEDAAFDYSPLVDGERFSFGDVEMVVRSVATPGHTPGSTSLEVAGRFLLTGDAIFVTGVGRPDLGGQTEPWARDLFHTIHDRLAGLSDDLLVCPAHYTSRGEANEGGSISRPLGDLMVNDPVVSISDESSFVDYVVSHLGEAPPVYADIRRVNLGVESVGSERIEELEVGRNECALKG